MIPIPADLDNSPPFVVSVIFVCFRDHVVITNDRRGGINRGVGGGALVGGGLSVVLGGIDSIRHATPFLVEDAPIRDGVNGGEADANEDGSGAIVRSVGGNGGGGGGFYGKEE